MTLQPLYETTAATLIGTVAALAVGVAPPAGAAMALLASLITRVATPALAQLPTIEDDGVGKGVPSMLVLGAWLAATTQVAQLFVRCIGYAAPFWGGLVIVSASIVISRLAVPQEATE